MYPAAFDYHAPGTIKEALQLLGKHKDDAKLLAGGHSLIPMMKLRLAQPEHLIDLGKVPGLSGIKQDGNMLAIGAMTTHWEVESSALVKSKLAVLSEVAAIIGDPAVRNRGTVGGSIAHADGAAELPLCLVALGGKVVVDGPGGRREIPAEEFFVTHFTTALTTGELVVETVWPLAATGESSAFEELALRSGDFAQSMVAVVLRRDASGTVVDASVAVGAVSDHPLRLREVERLLVGSSAAEAAADAGSLAASLVDPAGSIHASARYLRALTGALTTRAIERAA
jgi:CO/xanthine dehydrogenase FAD-binding subunit